MTPTPYDEASGGAGPLAGMLVLDLSRALSGPHAAMMLGDMGARVIKVEEPGGDQTRTWGPFAQGQDGSEPTSTYFLSCNRNKESIVLDLKSDDGAATIRALVARADVLVENFRPGVLARLGLDLETLAELNPGLVVLSISGFGHDGPEGGRPGYDQIAQGEAGLMSVTGPGPGQEQRVGVAISDVLAGMYGAFGVVSALVERGRTGRGQVVRTSLLASVVGVHAFQGTRWTVARELPEPMGNHHPTLTPYGLFHSADGPVQVACGTERQWQLLCQVIGLDPSGPGMTTFADRAEHRSEVIGAVEEAIAGRGAAELLEELTAAGVPCGRVRNLPEVYDWEQTRSQGLLLDVDHPQLGTIQLPGPPLRFFTKEQDAPEAEVTRRQHDAPPVLDADADRIRRWLAEPVA